MCGIAGFYDPTCNDDALIERMTDAITHRGPDAGGVWRAGPVQLGHRRLSIIDLAASVQPMSSDDGRVTLVFNGEIYNYRELRDELRAAGQQFHTDGDTEVLLAGYRVWGERVVEHLSGMLAFAIHDAADDTLFLARDQMGVKPLIYAWDGARFIFASEVKSVLQHPAVSREVDLDAISLYLECQYIPGPRSACRAVTKLPPAHTLTLRRGSAPELNRYWQASYRDKLQLSGDEATDALDDQFSRSVKSMMVADVPLGAFLSGGVDSSTVAAMMVRHSSRVRTFNVGFAGEDCSTEHEYARTVADHLGCEHHCLMVKPDDLLQELPRFLQQYDEPFGGQAALPTLMLARYTREHVTVALTGEGADEVFGGYRTYSKRLREERWCTALAWALGPVSRLLPGSLRKDRFLRSLSRRRAERHVTVPKQFAEELQGNYYTRQFRGSRSDLLRRYAGRLYDDCDAAGYLDRILDVDQRLWLPDDLLTKVDLATMAYSLEARVPFLDHDFVAFCARLPESEKVDGKSTKVVLKRLAERLLPHEIVHRKKSGFVMPIAKWLREDLRDQVEDALGDGGLAARGLLAPAALARLRDDHLSGRKDRGFRLWTLFVLEQWFRAHAPDFRLSP